MPSFVSDLRYAVRELRRRPGFALTAILSLALGIGATSAVFSVIYGVLLDPFPYVGAERMMQLSLKDTQGRLRYPGLSAAQLDALRAVKAVESAIGEDGWNLTTTDGDVPEDVVASYVTPNHANHWGVPALMGRWLVPADAPAGRDAERVTVLGYAFWQRYFSGDPQVIGKTIQLVRKNYAIVGVMPPRFKWRDPAEIYMPLAVKHQANVYYGVAARANEFGIRMALGAKTGDVVRMVLSSTSWTVGAGILLGVALCIALDKVAAQWLTEPSRDPLIIAGVTGVLIAVSALACLAPARRAASISPMTAVRHD